MAGPILIHGPNALGTRFEPSGLGPTDPFAACRSCAWTGPVGMAVGQVRWPGGSLDIADFPQTELIIVQHGRLVVETSDGTTVLSAGMAATLLRGAALRLQAAAAVTWSFCAGAVPERAAPGGAFQTIDPAMDLAPSPSPRRELLIGPTPVCHSADLVHDPDCALRVGVWASTPYVRQCVPHRVNELMHILEGSVTLTDDEGRSIVAGAGETLFVPRGAACAWTSQVPVRKIYGIQDVPA